METFVKLGLKEVANIIGILGLSTDIKELEEKDFEINGKKYGYYKIGNAVVIYDEDGKSVKVKVNHTQEKTKDYKNMDVIYDNHEVFMDYQLENGDIISLKNQIALDGGYEAFENVHRHDLLSGLSLKYVDKTGKKLASFSVGVDKVCLGEERKIYEFNHDGIVCGNKLLTLEGDKLLSIGGTEVPSREEVESFNINEQREIIDKFLTEVKGLHPFTRETLEDAYRKLDRKDRYAKDIKEFYSKDINEIREAIAVRQRIMDAIENDLIDYEALEVIGNELRNKTKKPITRTLIH